MLWIENPINHRHRRRRRHHQQQQQQQQPTKLRQKTSKTITRWMVGGRVVQSFQIFPVWDLPSLIKRQLCEAAGLLLNRFQKQLSGTSLREQSNGIWSKTIYGQCISSFFVDAFVFAKLLQKPRHGAKRRVAMADSVRRRVPAPPSSLSSA